MFFLRVNSLSILCLVTLLTSGIRPLIAQEEIIKAGPDDNGWIEIAVFVHGITPEKDVQSSERYYEGLHVNIEKYYNLLKSPEDKDYPFTDEHRIYVNYGANLPNTIKISSISDNLAEAEEIIVDLDQEVWNKTRDVPESFYRTRVIAGLREIILYGLSDAVYYLSPEGTREIRGSILNQIFRDLQSNGIINEQGKLDEGKKLSFTVFAHSLGTVIMFDIMQSIYSEHENLDDVYTEYGSKEIVEGFKKLDESNRIRIRKLYSFGSQMSLFHLRKENRIDDTINHRWQDVSHLFKDSSSLPDPRWLNFWDKDDILGYPTEFLFKPRAETGTKVVKDIHVDVDDYLPHGLYWFNEEMAFEICADFLGITRIEALEILNNR